MSSSYGQTHRKMLGMMRVFYHPLNHPTHHQSPAARPSLPPAPPPRLRARATPYLIAS